MSRQPELRVATPAVLPERAGEIRAELERVLSSHQFRGSRRCQTLLRHLTEQTLTGDTRCLKERSIGIDVFGRPPDYDTSQDPVVRATAAEIRKKLAQYYQEANHESGPRIDLVSGSYVVEFQFNGTTTPTPPAAEPGHQRRIMMYVALAAVALLILASAIAVPAWTRTDLEQFWSPLLKAPGAVLICVGQPIAYNLKSAQAQEAIQAFGIGEALRELPTQPLIPKKDLVILRDRYVALGDAACLVRVTSLLNKYGKAFNIRGERSTSFADLRDNPAVLIAAFDNQWTLQVARQLRFTFVRDGTKDAYMVRDRQHPENTGWSVIGAWPHWDIPNDYAIVSRVLDATTDRPVIIAAGITQHGTMGAGEFLGNPVFFGDAVSQLPRDWQYKNVQIVLRVPVLNHVPGRAVVVATHTW